MRSASQSPCHVREVANSNILCQKGFVFFFFSQFPSIEVRDCFTITAFSPQRNTSGPPNNNKLVNYELGCWSKSFLLTVGRCSHMRRGEFGELVYIQSVLCSCSFSSLCFFRASAKISPVIAGKYFWTTTDPG